MLRPRPRRGEIPPTHSNTRLSHALTTEQTRLLETREIRLDLDRSPSYPGCYIANDGRHMAAGRSPRLAIEARIAKRAR